MPIVWKSWEPRTPGPLKGLYRSVIGKVRKNRKLKKEALDLAVLRTRFGTGYGRFARQTAQ